MGNASSDYSSEMEEEVKDERTGKITRRLKKPRKPKNIVRYATSLAICAEWMSTATGLTPKSIEFVEEKIAESRYYLRKIEKFINKQKIKNAEDAKNTEDAKNAINTGEGKDVVDAENVEVEAEDVVKSKDDVD